MPTKDFTLEEIESLVEYIDTYQRDEYDELLQGYPKDKRHFTVDWEQFWRFDTALAEDCITVPEDFREAFADAIQRYDRNPVDADLSDTTVRFGNVSKHVLGVEEIREEHGGKLVTIDGQISKNTPVRPRVKEAAWFCEQCLNYTTLPCENGIVEPDECQSCGRQGPFNIDAQKSELVNHQLMRITQPPEDAAGGSTTGEHLDAHMEGDDLVAMVDAGNRAKVTGVLKMELGDTEYADFDWYLKVDSIRVEEDEYAEIDIESHRAEIEGYASESGRNPFELVAESVAPSIMGGDKVQVETPWGETYDKYWWIRFGVALSTLFGGWRKPNNDGTYQRGSSHALLIGDPSTGKSSIMSAIESLAPRSAFESGNNVSATGLTAGAIQDDFGDNQFSLEAGALVKAHRGVTCIDEIDKISKDALDRMHSALEKQRLEFNKGGIDATLKCETSLLASGNPENSRFNDVDTNQSQIDIVDSLLDRFDLVYVLKDRPDEERDRMKAKNVIKKRTEAGKVDVGIINQDDAETDVPAVPEDVMRSWVALARREYKPVLTDEVEERLADYYAEIRSKGESSDDPVPATIRNLKGLLRLSEASARLRLSEEVELIDAEMAIATAKVSLEDIGYDPESGALDVDWASGRTSYTQSDRINKIRGIVETLETRETGADRSEVIETATNAGIDREKAEKEVENMTDDGRLYEPKYEVLRTT